MLELQTKILRRAIFEELCEGLLRQKVNFDYFWHTRVEKMKLLSINCDHKPDHVFSIKSSIPFT